MARFLHHDFSLLRRKDEPLFLAFGWFFGIVFGVSLSRYGGDISASLMRTALHSPASIVSLASVTLFPFLISAFAVFISQHWLLPLIAAFKGICFSSLLCAIMQAYASAAWLMYPLIAFSQVATVPLLWLFWLRYCGRERAFSRATLAYFLAVLGIVCIDVWVISPFLAQI